MATYNTHTLRNGLRIIHLPDASPVVYCGYAINAGTRDEQTDEEGLAHFCEHVTFKGTQRRRAWHILNRLESVGGDLNAFTTKEDTVYYAAILKEHLCRAVDLLSDIVFHSVYPQAELDKARQEVVDQFEGILKMDGPENAHKLHHELGDIMYKYVSIERDNNGLDQCLVELKDILKRWDNIGLTDRGHWANQEAMFVRQLRNMILYAMCITKAARCRDESRGAHAKIALDANGKRMMDGEELVFMPRDDKNFMRISIVDYDPKTEEPIVSYDEFDHSLIKPRPRNYAVAKKE